MVIGLLQIQISVLAMIFYIATFFLYPDVPRGFTTMFVLILFLGGVQLLSVSIISEYIGKASFIVSKLCR